jgi:hypothetical protein
MSGASPPYPHVMAWYLGVALNVGRSMYGAL